MFLSKISLSPTTKTTHTYSESIYTITSIIYLGFVFPFFRKTQLNESVFSPDLLQQHFKMASPPSTFAHVNILKAAEIIFFKISSHYMPLKFISIALLLFIYVSMKKILFQLTNFLPTL